MSVRRTCKAKQTALGGLLIFIALIALSMMLGTYGLYIERTSTATSSNTTTYTTAENPAITNTTLTTTTIMANATTEHPYQPA